MAIIKFPGNWSEEWQKIFKVPKGYILIKPKPVSKKNIGIALRKLSDIQNKKKKLKDIDFTFEFHYKKRVLRQNNLMWALYEIEANEHNGNQEGHPEQMVTTQQLYDQDLLTYAPTMTMNIKKDYKDLIKSEWKILREKEVLNENKELIGYRVEVIISTSKFNTKQMAEWIDRIFNRLAYNGVSVENGADIQNYWRKWRQYLNDSRIVLHDEIMTADEYKALNPICEATGVYIGNKGGHLVHIKARGMGGNQEAYKDFNSNWLHLCPEAHSVPSDPDVTAQHQYGWSEFIKQYPHLKYKIETAMKRSYDDKLTNKIKNIFKGEEA